MIYGLTSKINIKKNEEFYKGNVQVEVDLLNQNRPMKKMESF